MAVPRAFCFSYYADPKSLFSLTLTPSVFAWFLTSNAAARLVPLLDSAKKEVSTGQPPRVSPPLKISNDAISKHSKTLPRLQEAAHSAGNAVG